MIMIDVDAFTTFNEHYGIGVGDNCLKRIAGVIENNCLRAGDVVSRFMADQFVAILPGTEFENAMRVAENICRAVASLNLINEYSDCADTVTVSVGIGAVRGGGNIAPCSAKRWQSSFGSRIVIGCFLNMTADLFFNKLPSRKK